MTRVGNYVWLKCSSCNAVLPYGVIHIGGPDPVLVLQPTVSWYSSNLGEDIPDVICIVDCNPDCKITWKKSESQVILSQNGTLSLGKAMRNCTGEYVCTATRTGTFKKGRASFFVKVHDEPGN